MIAEKHQHCAIQTYSTETGWGWNIFEDDNAIGTPPEEETFPNQEAALHAARKVAEKIEERWRNYGYELVKIHSFFEAYSNAEWEKPIKLWLDPLPGGKAWIAYYQKGGEPEPFTGTLMFSGIAGWKGTVRWIDVLVNAALEVPEEKGATQYESPTNPECQT
jgi:hypothetical protein